MQIAHALRRARQVGVQGTVVRLRRMVKQQWNRHTRDWQLVRTALVVRRQSGKSLTTQAAEILRLRWGDGKLSAYDYYAYDLYDDRRYTPAKRAQFVSLRPEDISSRANDIRWRGLCDDKLITYAIFNGLGLSHPELFALYHPGGRTHGALPCLRTPEEMAEFLRADMPYPFFGKPVKDSLGGGASSVDAIDRERDMLILPGGAEINVPAYVSEVPAARIAGQRFVDPRPAGYLFQQRITQHPAVSQLTGGPIATLRLIILLIHGVPRLFRAGWRIPARGNITDHFLEGSSGNLRGWINPDSGRVDRVMEGATRDHAPYALGSKGRHVDRHPDTGERIVGYQIPEWPALVAKCLHAAAAFPGVRYQAWDLAIGPAGPIFVELNFNGGIPQMPDCPGMYDECFRDFFAPYRPRRGN